MFTSITTALFSQELQRIIPSLSSRSIRRGALQSLTAKGIPHSDSKMLSHHRSMEGLMRYVDSPDHDTLALLLELQRLL